MTTLCLTWSPGVLAVETVNLEKCLQIASEHNPQFKQFEENINRTKAVLNSKYGAFLPRLNVAANRIETSSTTQTLTATNSIAQLNLNANINLFNGFADKATLDIAKIEHRIALARLDEVNSELTYNVKVAYYEVLFAHENLRLLSEIRGRRQEQLDMIRLLFKGGREDQGSFLQAQAKFENATYELNQAERSLETSMQKLSYALGYSEPMNFQIDDQLVLKDYIQINVAELDNAVRAIPSYIILAEQVEVANTEITKVNAAWWPTLNLNGASGKAGNSFSNMDQDAWNFGVYLNIPIFQGGTRYYNSSTSYRLKASREHEFANKFNSLKVDLVSAYNDYKNNYQNIGVQEQFLQASKLRSEVMTSQYKSGLTTYTSWDLVQNEFVNYEKMKLLSLKNLMVSEANLRKVMGIGELK